MKCNVITYRVRVIMELMMGISAVSAAKRAESGSRRRRARRVDPSFLTQSAGLAREAIGLMQ
jgi:hypothetical protein